jgi:hypothetical protein
MINYPKSNSQDKKDNLSFSTGQATVSDHMTGAGFWG